MPRNPSALVLVVVIAATLVGPATSAVRTTAVAPAPVSDDARDLSPNLFPLPIERILFPDHSALDGLRADAPGADLELEGSNESSVAVNPLNAMNIAYASLWELRVSTDGGVTFQTAVPPLFPETHLPAGDPSVAFDSQGRLFWSYIGTSGTILVTQGYDLFVAQCDPSTGAILPGYPTNVTEQAGLPGSAGNFNDKSWLAIDSWPGSPYQDRLYLGWTDLPGTGSFPYCVHSSDHGLTWSAAVGLGGGGSPFWWPVHVAVAPNGDVYAAKHRQITVGGVPDGTSGRIIVMRSTDGGVTFPQSGNAATAGNADITFNRQDTSHGQIPGAIFVTTGSVQPWILPDPAVTGRVFCVFADDPDNNHDVGDASNIYIARSDDSGSTWTAPQRVDSGPGTTFQLFPTATIDRNTGAVAVTWYDNRSGAVNDDGHYLLDLYGAVRLDPNSSFGQDFRISDVPLDPDAGAPCRFSCVGTLVGVWMANPSLAYACGFAGPSAVQKWDGNAWSVVNTGGSQVPFCVWGSGPNHVWTVGSGGEIREWNGASWSAAVSGTGLDFLRIHGSSDTDVYAVGANGIIVHWDGVSWTTQASGTTEQLTGVCALPGGIAWAIGFHGTVLRYDGLSWSPQPAGGIGTMLGLWANSDADVWVAGTDGLIRHSNGATWTTLNSGTTALSGAWGTSPTNMYFGAVTGLVHWDGTSFEKQSFAEGQVTTMHGTSASDILAVGVGSRIGHFDGTSWTRLPNPGEATNPTTRIGEYNGLGAGIMAVVTWTGNTVDALLQPVDQQSFFDSFDFPWQVGAPAVTPVASLLLMEPGRPNPFRWMTRISYNLPKDAPVRVSVHDASGRLVSELESGVRTAGPHEVTWDGRDHAGQTAANGVYFVRLETARESRVSKLVLVR